MMKITSKTTRAELLKAYMEAEERALGSYHELLEVRGKLNAAVAQMGDNKPWKLAAIFYVAGVAAGWVIGAVM